MELRFETSSLVWLFDFSALHSIFAFYAVFLFYKLAETVLKTYRT
jgi:hypothetical protein